MDYYQEFSTGKKVIINFFKLETNDDIKDKNNNNIILVKQLSGDSNNFNTTIDEINKSIE